MSTVLRNELDMKLQQMRECALIAHGYHNENLRYPVQVRRSHDGEKLAQEPSIGAHLNCRHPRSPRLDDPTVLTPHLAENRTRHKREATSIPLLPSSDEHATTIAVVPPNKTISDIHPLFHRDRFHSLRNTSASGSSSRHGSTRPHSIAGTSLRTNADSSQSSSKTLTQRLISKLFPSPSKL